MLFWQLEILDGIFFLQLVRTQQRQVFTQIPQITGKSVEASLDVAAHL